MRSTTRSALTAAVDTDPFAGGNRYGIDRKKFLQMPVFVAVRSIRSMYSRFLAR